MKRNEMGKRGKRGTVSSQVVLMSWNERFLCAPMRGSVANGVFGDVSMFRNTVKIGLFLFQKPDKWLFATERTLLRDIGNSLESIQNGSAKTAVPFRAGRVKHCQFLPDSVTRISELLEAKKDRAKK